MDALLSKSCSSTGRIPMGAELSGPAGLGETLRDDTSGSSAPHDGGQMKAFRFPSSPDEGLPKMSCAEMG